MSGRAARVAGVDVHALPISRIVYIHAIWRVYLIRMRSVAYFTMSELVLAYSGKCALRTCVARHPRRLTVTGDMIAVAPVHRRPAGMTHRVALRPTPPAIGRRQTTDRPANFLRGTSRPMLPRTLD